jgi:hypothetical protein
VTAVHSSPPIRSSRWKLALTVTQSSKEIGALQGHQQAGDAPVAEADQVRWLLDHLLDESHYVIGEKPTMARLKASTSQVVEGTVVLPGRHACLVPRCAHRCGNAALRRRPGRRRNSAGGRRVGLNSVDVTEKSPGTVARVRCGPLLNPYRSCHMRLMRLLDALGVRG